MTLALVTSCSWRRRSWSNAIYNFRCSDFISVSRSSTSTSMSGYRVSRTSSSACDQVSQHLYNFQRSDLVSILIKSVNLCLRFSCLKTSSPARDEVIDIYTTSNSATRSLSQISQPLFTTFVFQDFIAGSRSSQLNIT